jgi:hypothetical protein
MLNRYKFKSECCNFRTSNVIPKITTKKIAIKDTQKDMERNLNILLKKSAKHQEDSEK